MRLEDEIKQQRFENRYQKLVLNLVYTGSWLNAHSVRWLKPYGLSPQQYNILRILRGQHPNPATVLVIKERMLDKMSNVSRLVEKLRVKGLLDRRTCATDRRAVDVFITPKGLALLTEIDGQEEKGLDLVKTLSPEEVDRLNDLLDKLRG
ncbi:MAG: MarR family winged helix-turn-helix transcriptional regulator [Rhodothermales bacterium]